MRLLIQIVAPQFGGHRSPVVHQGAAEQREDNGNVVRSGLDYQLLEQIRADLEMLFPSGGYRVTLRKNQALAAQLG